MTSTQFTLPPESPFGRATLPVLALSLGVLFAVTRPPATPPLITALFGLLGVAYLPGLAAALWVENRFGLWASWILPLILAPVLSVSAGLLLNQSGVRLDDTAPWIVFLSVLAVVFAPPPRREIEDYAVSMEMPGFLRLRSDRQQVIGLAIAVLALIALPLLSRAWIRSCGDAAVDLAATEAILARGLPAQDPLMAGLPFRSFWAFHAYLSVLHGATRMEPDMLLLGGSLIAAFVLIFTGYRLLNQLALPHARSLWGAAFLFFSLNGLFWLLIPLRTLSPVRVEAGFTERLLAPLTLDPMGRSLALPPQGTFFLERFFTAGPFVLALVYMLLFLMATMASVGENRLRWNLLAFLAGLGMLLFHSGVGLTILAVTLISIPVIWIAARLNPFRGQGWALTGTILPMGLALLAAAPYLAHLLRRGPVDYAAFLQLSPRNILLVLGALLPSLLLGAGVLVRFLAGSDIRRQAWTVWTVLLLTLSLLLLFPGPQPLLGPITLAHVPISLAAGSAVPLLWQRVRGGARAGVAIALFLILVPRTLLGVVAYMTAPAPPVAGPEAREAAAWLAEHSPARAVVADVAPDIALAARRTALYGRPARDWTGSYRLNAMVKRKAAQTALLRGTRPDPEQADLLLAFGAPIYVVERSPKNPGTGSRSDARELFANREYRIWLWLPSVGGSPDSTR